MVFSETSEIMISWSAQGSSHVVDEHCSVYSNTSVTKVDKTTFECPRQSCVEVVTFFWRHVCLRKVRVDVKQARSCDLPRLAYLFELCSPAAAFRDECGAKSRWKVPPVMNDRMKVCGSCYQADLDDIKHHRDDKLQWQSLDSRFLHPGTSIQRNKSRKTAQYHYSRDLKAIALFAFLVALHF